MRYAIIENEMVVNVVESDAPVGVASETANIGDRYENGEFIKPDPAPQLAPAESFGISKLAFKNRFPRDKWKAAKAAASVSIDMADFFEDFELALFINLQDPRTIASVNDLADISVPVEFRLTAEEVANVIETPCQPGEEP